MDEDIILGGLAILFTGMVVLVPILGITLRFAIKPFFDTWAEIQRSRVASEDQSLHERRLEVLEAEVQQVQHALRSVLDAQEFQQRLADPVSPQQARPGDHSTAGRIPTS
jgi:hypothetical protein